MHALHPVRQLCATEMNHGTGAVPARAAADHERSSAASGRRRIHINKVSALYSRWWTLVIVVLALCLPSNVDAADVCTFKQITSSIRPSGAPAISGSGIRAVFHSSQGLFVADLLTRTLTQLHADSGSPGAWYPRLDDSGTRIVSASDNDLTGENPDLNSEIFLFDLTAGTITQITHTTRFRGQLDTNSFPSISSDGKRIVFQSRGDFNGDNPDQEHSVYLFDTETGTFTLVAQANNESLNVRAVNSDGTRIVLVTDGSPTGQNPDGNNEIFVFDAATGVLTQITQTVGADNASPTMNGAGSLIAFSSNADFTGENPDRNSEIFSFQIPTSRMTQVTRTIGTSNRVPSLNGDGTRIAFISGANITGENADRNSEWFLFDTISAAFTQVTRTTDSPGVSDGMVSNDSVISVSGTRLAIGSRHDLAGENPDRNYHLFAASCGLVNDVVSLTTLADTYRTAADSTGCPAGFMGTFSLVARLASRDSSPSLRDLRVQVITLTNGNLLRNADGGPGGLAARLTVPRTGMYADGVLSAGETVDVPLAICLKNNGPFQLLVDVLGTSE